MLSNQASDHPGKNVASTARGHRGAAGRIDPTFSIRERDDGPVAFENDRCSTLASKFLCDSQTIRLNFARRLTCKPSHLARMGREDSRFVRFWQPARQSV